MLSSINHNKCTDNGYSLETTCESDQEVTNQRNEYQLWKSHEFQSQSELIGT